MAEEEYISKEKKIELEKELEYLTTVKRKELAESLQKARALGDLSENAEYHAVREEQGLSEDRIRQIKNILKKAKVVEVSLSNKKKGVVVVGSRVLIVKKNKNNKWDTEVKTVEIVGGEESDMLSGKISFKSPLGSALLNQTKGAQVKVITPKGEIIYKIVEVE